MAVFEVYSPILLVTYLLTLISEPSGTEEHDLGEASTLLNFVLLLQNYKAARIKEAVKE